MTRKLPWRDGVPDIVSRGSSARASDPARRVKAEPNDSGAESMTSRLPSTASLKRAKRPSNRPASTSPPPEALQESFMVEGYDEDDRYRMVEDEFNATAQRFTAHLHAAEYQKLKEAAKSQNAETIQNISRPVVGRMTDLVKKKQDRADRLKRQKSATNKDDTDDDTDSDSHRRGTSLFGLMQSPRKKVPPLNSANATHSLTRAAAGFGKVSLADSGPGLPNAKVTSKLSIECESHGKDDGNSRALPRHTSTNLSTHHAKSEAVEPLSNHATSLVPQKRRTTPQPQPKEQALGEDAPYSSDDDTGEALFGFQKRSRRRMHVRNKPSQPRSAQDNVIPGFL